MSNRTEEEPVKFRVVMTSDAAIKEVSLNTSTTKLLELKNILAQQENFGSRAPVKRQRLFHLGRELKSGGRSLCNLGLGRFNNRILHLYVRPDENENGKIPISSGGVDSIAGSRKRNRDALQQQQQQQQSEPGFRRQSLQRSTSAIETIDVHDDPIEQVHVNSTTISSISSRRPMVSTNNSTSTGNNRSNTAIDLVDSSDDDEVEVIEVL